MKRMLEGILVLLTLALAACASTPVVFTDYDRSAQFGNYHTYAWREDAPPPPEAVAPPLQPHADQPALPMQPRGYHAAPQMQQGLDQAAPLMRQRIVDAIDAQ